MGDGGGCGVCLLAETAEPAFEIDVTSRTEAACAVGALATFAMFPPVSSTCLSWALSTDGIAAPVDVGSVFAVVRIDIVSGGRTRGSRITLIYDGDENHNEGDAEDASGRLHNGW